MKNPIRPNLKTELLPLVTLLAVVAASFYFYQNLPETVPTHWNFEGEVDGWSPRWAAAFMMPVILVFIYGLFLFMPFLDPKKERYVQFKKVYHVFKSIIVLFMALIYFITGLSGMGYSISVSSVVPVMIGLLFIIIGNYMSKIKPNWFMGIRTPWTLSSEDVWNKTHRFGAKMFIIGGLIIMLMNFFTPSLRLPLFVVSVFMMSLGTFAYSFFLYSKEQNKINGNNNQSAKSADKKNNHSS